MLLKLRLWWRNVWVSLTRTRPSAPDWQDIREFCRDDDENQSPSCQ